MGFRQAARRVQGANHAIKSMRFSDNANGRFYRVHENRGRRLFNLIRLGYLDERTLGAADRQELDRYRQTVSSSRPVQQNQSAVGQTSLQRSAPLPPPMPISTPVLRGRSQPSRAERPTTIAQAMAPLRPPSERRPVQETRSVEVPPLMREIDRRIASGQIDPNRKDPKDFRDQIQGASDAEWENS
ncbi:MAG: hypothetical protein H6925_05585 [Holosporaceae bacterium]|nr:MAG: hypothetical protein H6925_05585 [Holosporaceae bacterium]